MERELEADQSLWELFECIVRLEDRQDCARFFRDLCTLTELKAMAERWQVARLLDRRLPYRQISQLTGASTATITRIAHWLRHGEGGYRAALARSQPGSGGGRGEGPAAKRTGGSAPTPSGAGPGKSG